MATFKKKNGEKINIANIECIEVKKNEILVFEVDEYFNTDKAYEIRNHLQKIAQRTGIGINFIFKTSIIKKIYKIIKGKK